MFCSTATMPSTPPVMERTGCPAMMVSTSPTWRGAAIGSPAKAVATISRRTSSAVVSMAVAPKRLSQNVERAVVSASCSAASQPRARACQSCPARSAVRTPPISARMRPSASITTMCMSE